MSIFDYVKGLKTFFHKDEIIDDLRVSIQTFEKDVVPQLKTIISLLAHSSIKDNLVIPDSLVSLNNSIITNMNGENGKDVFEVVYTHATHITNNAKYIKETLEKELSTTTVSGGLTAQKAVLIRSSEQFSFLVEYMVNYTQYFFDVLEDSPPVKAIQDEIKNSTFEFAKAFNTLSDSEFKEKIEQIPNIIVSAQGDADQPNPALSTLSLSKLDPFNTTSLQDFIGNPIYHFRSLLTTYQTNKYKLMQEKKKLLELRLMYLKDKAENNPNPAMDKKIESMQNYISELEYKLKKMED